MTRTYARSPRGERSPDAVPRNRGNVLTMLGALAPTGVTAMMTVEGATTKEVFDAFIEHVLLPKLIALFRSDDLRVPIEILYGDSRIVADRA
jgi:hypothetical protein